MYPELVTRRDLQVFLPPIGGTTLYIFGDPAAIRDPARRLTCRMHDECNGSDVFGSDICTCRPYLTHGVEECIREAQAGGAGLIVYNRKEGRALGEVTKFLVYNARKRQAGGDQAVDLFCAHRVRCRRTGRALPAAHARYVALARHHPHRRLVSMSNLKYDALIARRHRDRRARAAFRRSSCRRMRGSRSRQKRRPGTSHRSETPAARLPRVGRS